MKKTFNRLLAATVAIPVALGQILAISANAAEAPAKNAGHRRSAAEGKPGDWFPD